MDVTVEGRVNDVLKSIHIIEGHLTGMSKDDFLKDLKTQDAVAARIMAIGEHMGESAHAVVSLKAVWTWNCRRWQPTSSPWKVALHADERMA